MPKEIFDEDDLVMITMEVKGGWVPTWWRVKFIDNGGEFYAGLEKSHRDFTRYPIGHIESFHESQVKRKYKEGDQFCYSDNVTVCHCSGLCHNKM